MLNRQANPRLLIKKRNKIPTPTTAAHSASQYPTPSFRIEASKTPNKKDKESQSSGIGICVW
jgi:hypothetical protein